jgi:hypothetical protein
MASFLFRDDDGWPYPDPDVHAAIEIPDHALDIDDDLMCLRGPHPHLFDGLGPVERTVVTARFGLDGAPIRSMKELQSELGLPHADVRAALETGLAKLRTQLA